MANILSITTVNRPDNIGAMASGLCLIHCLATPVLFVVQACSISGCAGAPIWWRAVDFVFLAISAFAVYWSARTTAKGWMKYAMWSAWVGLAFVIFSEQIIGLHLGGGAIFVPSIALIGLHIYNSRYCQCADDDCCLPV